MTGTVDRAGKRAAATVLLAIAAGSLAGLGMGHLAQRRQGRAELYSYAERLLGESHKLAFEAKGAADAVDRDGLPFCSHQEIQFMRRLLFQAPDIRDLGHTQAGTLGCTTSNGRLAHAKPSPPPDLVTPDGVAVRASTGLAIAPGIRGLVVEIEHVSVVFNPAFYSSLDEPPMTYGSVIYVRPQRRMIYTLGHPMPLDFDETMSGKFIRKNGIMYRPVCSTVPAVCMVAAEPVAAMRARTHYLVSYYAISGAILGGAVGLIVVLTLETRRAMARQLRRAVRRGELTLEYQPVVDLQSGRIVAAEALVRWKRNGRDPIAPNFFIQIAEDHGFLRDLTRLVVRRALEELTDMLSASEIYVTINISSEDVVNPEFAAFIESALARASVPPSSLGLELTERSTANHAVAIESIRRLKGKGHRVYIDDFGTGYSSLSYLHELDVDAIKIDRSFTQTIGTEAVTASVVPQILAMAAQLNLLVVAEGIETAEQAAYFAAAPVKVLAQGFFFERPMSAAKLRDLLKGQGRSEAGGTSQTPGSSVSV
jgi:sensor c-di-GMP phosphodiesterase-like protein